MTAVEAFCLASGPSLNAADVEAVKAWRNEAPGRIVVVANTTFRAAPWADAIFAVDKAWWGIHGDEVQRDFAGGRYSSNNVKWAKHLKSGSGFKHFSNSGCGAVSVAIMLGAKQIYLLGFDCQHTNGKAHWHADHPKPLGNAKGFKTWPEKFNRLKDYASKARVNIINCSRHTALKMFQKEELEKCLANRVESAVKLSTKPLVGCSRKDIAICLIASKDQEANARTLESLRASNDLTDRTLLSVVAADVQCGLTGFKNVANYVNDPCTALRSAFKEAARLGASAMMTVPAGWECEREIPWDQIANLLSNDVLYTVRLYGAFKGRHCIPCDTAHRGKPGRPEVLWSPLVDIWESADIHWSPAPCVTRIQEALMLTAGNAPEKIIRRRSGGLRLLTARPTENIFSLVDNQMARAA